MRKTNYTLCLDAEKVEALKKWLDERGLSFSGYINAVIDEQLAALELYAPRGDKRKVTTRTLLKMAGQMASALKKEVKKCP